MDNKRPTIQIKNAHPSLRDYVFYLESKGKTIHGLIWKIQALEKENKELRKKNSELQLLNERLQCENILDQIIIRNDLKAASAAPSVASAASIASTASAASSAPTILIDKKLNIHKLINSMDELNISTNATDNEMSKSSLQLAAFNKCKLANMDDKIEKILDNDNGNNPVNIDDCDGIANKNDDNDNHDDHDNDNDNDDGDDDGDDDDDSDTDSSDNDDNDTDYNTDDDEDSSNSIIIKHVNRNLIKNDLAHFIYDISRPMNIKLRIDGKKNDIKAVNEFNKNFTNMNDMNSITLLVCFYKRQMKINFLQYKAKLKKHPIFCSLNIEDYVSDRTFQLYRYAKILKHQYNYAAIFWRNNRVYGQKSKSIMDCIEIKSRSDVNKLKKMENKHSLLKRTMKDFKKAKKEKKPNQIELNKQ